MKTPVAVVPAAALYLRVSTVKQTVENQRRPLEDLAAARGWKPVWYEETASSVKERPVFERLLEDARAGRVRVVATVALDRLGRSMMGIIATVHELLELGVTIISLREPWLETGGPARTLLLAIFGWMAEQERTLIIERTHAGLAQARAEGKELGRPLSAESLLLEAKRLVVSGECSIREAAKRVSRGLPKRPSYKGELTAISAATLHRYLKGTWSGLGKASRRAPKASNDIPTPAAPETAPEAPGAFQKSGASADTASPENPQV